MIGYQIVLEEENVALQRRAECHVIVRLRIVIGRVESPPRCAIVVTERRKALGGIEAELGLFEPIRSLGHPLDRLIGHDARSGRVVLDMAYAKLPGLGRGLGVHRAALFDVLHDAVVAQGIEVEDTGVGIAPEDMAALFTEFRQLPNNRKAEQGTGLGLALARHIVEAQGGSVGARSILGRGSVFVAEFPINALAATTQL